MYGKIPHMIEYNNNYSVADSMQVDDWSWYLTTL